MLKQGDFILNIRAVHPHHQKIRNKSKSRRIIDVIVHISKSSPDHNVVVITGWEAMLGMKIHSFYILPKNPRDVSMCPVIVSLDAILLGPIKCLGPAFEQIFTGHSNIIARVLTDRSTIHISLKCQMGVIKYIPITSKAALRY